MAEDLAEGHAPEPEEGARVAAGWGPDPFGRHRYRHFDGDAWTGYVSGRDGGTLIEYEDEDPQIRADFEAEIGAKGIECKMPVFARR